MTEHNSNQDLMQSKKIIGSLNDSQEYEVDDKQYGNQINFLVKSDVQRESKQTIQMEIKPHLKASHVEDERQIISDQFVKGPLPAKKETDEGLSEMKPENRFKSITIEPIESQIPDHLFQSTQQTS